MFKFNQEPKEIDTGELENALNRIADSLEELNINLGTLMDLMLKEKPDEKQDGA